MVIFDGKYAVSPMDHFWMIGWRWGNDNNKRETTNEKQQTTKNNINIKQDEWWPCKLKNDAPYFLVQNLKSSGATSAISSIQFVIG